MLMEATRVRLRVSPGAKRAAVVGRHGEAWKVRVAAPAEDGRANAAVVRLIATAVSVSPESVRLVSVHSARDKIVELAGIDAASTDRRLASAAGKERA
jgi:uncharacterized protein (TIGR00251 family)